MNQYLLCVPDDGYLNLICVGGVNVFLIGLLSFWRGFAGGTFDLFLSQEQFVVHH